MIIYYNGKVRKYSGLPDKVEFYPLISGGWLPSSAQLTYP